MLRPVQVNINLSVPLFFNEELKFGGQVSSSCGTILNTAVSNLIDKKPSGVPENIKNSLYKAVEKLKKANQNSEDNLKQLFRCEIGIMLAMNDENNRKNKLNDVIEQLRSYQNKDDELWWYYAGLLQIKAITENTFDSELLDNTLTCIENIQSMDKKNGLLAFLTSYVRYSNYINPLLVDRLTVQFTEYSDYLSGYFANKNHEYIKSEELKNHIFYDLEKSEGRISNNGVEIVVPTKLDPNLQANFRKMLVFYAHLCPPKVSSIKFNLPENIPANLQEKINQDLTEKFFEEGIYNSEKTLTTTENGSSFKTTEVKRILVEVLQTYQIELPTDYNTEKLKKNLNSELKNKLALQGRLKGFYSKESIALLHYCLSKADQHYPIEQPLAGEMQHVLETLKRCWENLFDISGNYGASNATPQKNAGNLKIAKKLIQNMIDNHTSLIIELGTPIKVGGTNSTHAFYIVLKYVEENQIPKLHIIITNGGLGVNKFHNPQYLPGEQKEYRYASFSLVELSQQNKDHLAQYIAYAQSLGFKQAEADDSKETDVNGVEIGQSPNTFNRLMKKLYQPEATDFGGLFIRQDIDKTFFAQVTGNCSVHNLKYALKILFNMSEAKFGYFLDRAQLGLNKILQESFANDLHNINNAPTNNLVNPTFGP